MIETAINKPVTASATNYHWPDLARMGGVVVVYTLLAFGSHLFLFFNSTGTMVWPPSGLALAVILMGGRKYLPAIFAAVLVSAFLIGRDIGIALPNAIFMTLSVLIASWQLSRTRFGLQFVHARDYLLLVMAGALGSLVNAAGGVTTAWLYGNVVLAQIPYSMLRWWQGDLLGILLVVPMLLVWQQLPSGWFTTRTRRIETILSFGVAFLLGQIAFVGWFANLVGTSHIGYFGFAIILFGALRFGRHGVLLFIAMVSVQALYGNANGAGFFGGQLPIQVWLYLATVAATGITVSLVMYAKEQAQNEISLSRRQLASEKLLLQAILDNAPLGIWMADATGKILFINKTLRTATGISDRQFMRAAHYTDVLPPSAFANFMRSDQECIAQEKSPHLSQEWLPFVDGKDHLLEITKVTLLNLNGSVKGLIGIAVDITERNANMVALEESQQRNRVLNDTSPVGIVIHQADKIVYVNPAAVEMLGARDAAELIGMSILQRIIPSSHDVRFRAALAQNITLPRIDEKFVQHDGSIVDLEIQGTPIRDEGKPAMLISFQDIGFRKQAELRWRANQTEISELLAATERSRLTLLSVVEDQKASTQAYYEAEQRLANIIDSAMDAVITVDDAHRIMVFNAAAAAMFHCPADQALGQPLSRFIPERFRTRHAEQMRTFASDNRSAANMAGRAPIFALRADGMEFPVEASITHVIVAGRQIFSVFLRDISERYAAEMERASLEAQLAQAQKMESLGTLAGGIAHDFNNILGAIMGNVALAGEEPDLPDAVRLSLGEIAKAGRRATSLVEQILAFSRKQSQEQSSQLLHPLLEEAVSLLRATAPAAVNFKVALTAGPMYAQVNATQMSQVMMNLLTNAWHALEKGKGNIDLELDEVQLDKVASKNDLAPGRYARIRVRDDGHGMDEAIQLRIFEPFFTTKKAGSGTGLGLAVVHGIIKTHRGSITCRSAPGKGSEFEILLPIVIASEIVVRPRTAKPLVLDGGGRHLIYLDDDVLMLEMVERLLIKRGFRVSVFLVAAEALAAVRATPEKFDLVVTDFNMPRESGLDIARAIRLIRPELPVVITTGYITDELREEAREAGVRHIVHKPNSVEDLVEAIALTLG